MKLSIIIPVYNEEKTIEQTLKKILNLNIPQVSKEIIIVNDGSTDATEKIVEKIKTKEKSFKIINHKKNLGKGAAVITGIKAATGDFIVIQDADSEYDPKDIIKLTKKIENNSSVIYGTRLDRLPNLNKDEKVPLFLMHFLGNRFLSLITSILYGQWITDMETCYKLFPRKEVLSMTLKAKGFEFEPEITSKLMKKGLKIKEVPISTKPRGYEQGKKLSALRDGPKALWALLKYRFAN